MSNHTLLALTLPVGALGKAPAHRSDKVKHMLLVPDANRKRGASQSARLRAELRTKHADVPELIVGALRKAPACPTYSEELHAPRPRR